MKVQYSVSILANTVKLKQSKSTNATMFIVIWWSGESGSTLSTLSTALQGRSVYT